MHTKFWLKNLMGKDHLKDLGVGRRILLEWILKNRVGWCGLNSSSSGWGPVVGSFATVVNF
jgi:hypothetical protein